jgi:hypothetical protein
MRQFRARALLIAEFVGQRWPAEAGPHLSTRRDGSDHIPPLRTVRVFAKCWILQTLFWPTMARAKLDTMACAQRRRLIGAPQRVERVGRYPGGERGPAVTFSTSFFVPSERRFGILERFDRIAFGKE